MRAPSGGGRGRTITMVGAVAVVGLAWVLAGGSASPAEAQTSGVSGQVSPQAGQAIDGFGVSGAWWPAALSQFPDAVQARLEQLIFSPTGLDVSQYRYLIGSGGVGVPAADKFRTAPSFLTPNGTYDWDADPAGLQFLQEAKQNQVGDLVVFANAPPAVLNSNHRSCGVNLTAAEVAPYAAFLTTVVSHLVTVEGIPVGYISPMNEPTYSQPHCIQEGMSVAPALRASLISTLARDLSAAHLKVGIVADESVTTENLVNNVDQWLPKVRPDVAVLSDHNYDWPTAAQLAEVNQLGLPHWATEICCHQATGFGTGFDPTMGSGLWLAQTIYADLVYGGYSAFDWWLAASPDIGCNPIREAACVNARHDAGGNDGLIYYDPDWQADHNYSLYLTKRYWVMQAYSRYVRPGAVLHPVDGLPSSIEAVSFVSGGEVVTVATNLSKHAEALRLAPAAGSWGAASAVQTDQAESARAVPAAVVAKGAALAVPLAADSVTTIVAHLAG